MTNPPGPSHGDSPWSRPSGQTPPPGPPGGRRPPEPKTEQLSTRRPTPAPSASPTRGMPAAGRVPESETERLSAPTKPPESPPGTPPKTKRARLLRDPLAMVLVVVTVLALVLAGLIGVELYARHRGVEKVTAATTCEVEDGATVKFGVSPPFLWQHITGRYTNISIHTDGNQVKDAKLMTADLQISDVRLQDTGDSRGSIGALDATLTWPSEGIKETIQSVLPKLADKLGSGLASTVSSLAKVKEVSTDPGAGTVKLVIRVGVSIISTDVTVEVKPTVVDNQLKLEVVDNKGGIADELAEENLQPILDKFASELTSKYPMGIHADSVEVTDSGVIAKFSTRDASIPASSDNPCFADL